MSRFGVAPCQCSSSAWKSTRSPGRMTSMGPLRRWQRPTPSVTNTVCPSGCRCQWVRAPGMKCTITPQQAGLPRVGAGAGFRRARGETERWTEVGVPAVAGFLSWLRNGCTVEHALVAPADGPSAETLEARLAAVISYYRWHEAVFGVKVAGRLMRGAPRRTPARGLLAHLDARSTPGPSSLVRRRL